MCTLQIWMGSVLNARKLMFVVETNDQIAVRWKGSERRFLQVIFGYLTVCINVQAKIKIQQKSLKKWKML